MTWKETIRIPSSKLQKVVPDWVANSKSVANWMVYNENSQNRHANRIEEAEFIIPHRINPN
mgnify:CR=1 FL=1